MKNKKRLAFYIFTFVALLVIIMIVKTSFLSRAHENPSVDELAGAVQRTESLIKIVSGEATLSVQNPYIQHIRIAFNGYLDGTNIGISDPVSAQVSAVDTEYLKSKFVPLSITDNTTGGGKQINILFVDKPDAVFWVWVYKAANEYDLRGITKNTKFSQEFIRDFQRDNEDMLENKAHAL